MSICKYCKHVNEDGTPFCQVCGKALDVFPDPTIQVGQQPSPSVEDEENTPAADSIPPVPQSVPSQSAEGAGLSTSLKSNPDPKRSNYTNTFPMNDKDRQAYAEKLANPDKPDHDGLCVLALMFGMLSFIINPLFITSLVAIILGIIGHASGGPKSSIAKLGWILGLISLVVYIVIALLITAMAFSLVWWIIHLFI
ncbi:MAG: energy-coupling factor transporter transmembrane protein EcfT [Clostridiales bacterium]|nr:energy-coupling factor transporter transmembrane protein EcfT [Clostridiales bacterium]